MDDLDQLFTNARLKADTADLHMRLLGHVINDAPPPAEDGGVIHLEATRNVKPKDEAIGTTSKPTPGESAALQRGQLVPPTPVGVPTPEQEALQSGSPASDVIGDLGKVAVGALGDERNAWMGTGLVAGAAVRWSKAGKELAAEFLGVQKGYKGAKDIELWNLKEDLPGHPSGSTISTETIEKAGFAKSEVPATSAGKAGEGELLSMKNQGGILQVEFAKPVSPEQMKELFPGGHVEPIGGPGSVGKQGTWYKIEYHGKAGLDFEAAKEAEQRLGGEFVRRQAAKKLGPAGLLSDERGSIPAAPGGQPGLQRERFQAEGFVENLLNPSPLAERVTEAINSKTAVLSDAEAATRAKALIKSGGVTRESLVNYAPGTALVSAPHALAAQELLTNELDAFLKVGYKAIDTADPAQVDEAIARFSAILDPTAGLTGAATASGQALRKATGEKLKTLNLLIEHASQTKANMTPYETLQHILSVPGLTPEGIITAVNTAKTNPTWRDAFQYLLINSMLGPSSDFINFWATASSIPLHLGARKAAEIVGVAEKLGDKSGIMVGETEAMMHGLFSSFGDSLKLAYRVAKTGHAEIGPAALRENKLGQNPMTADAMFGYSPTARRLAGIEKAEEYNSASYPVISRAGGVSAAINFMSTTLGLPGRLMLTGDQFIQNMAMNAETHAIVWRKTLDEALKGGHTGADALKAYRAYWGQVSRNLPAEIRKAGETFSLELSLNSPPGPIGTKVMQLRDKVNEVTGIGGTIMAPFYNTLANSSKATFEFSPLAPASNLLGLVTSKIRSDMFGNDPVKRDLALGKWAFGSTLMAGFVWAALNGRLTGRGPDNKELRAQGYEAEGLPDSFIYNTDTGERIQVQRLGILGNLVGMAADVSEVWLHANEHDRTEMLQLLTTAYVGNLSVDFMQNSVGVAQAIFGGVKKKEDVDILMKQLTAFTPASATIRAGEKALTPDETPLLIKDARTSLDKYLARFPGYDTASRKFGLDPIPVYRNQFGYAVVQPKSAYGTEWFNPLYISGPSKNETLRDLSKIEIQLGMAIEPPANKVGEGGVPFTAKEYDTYQKLAGEQWETRAAALLPTLKRSDITDDMKRSLITNHLTAARTTAANILKSQSRDLVDAITSRKIQQKTEVHAPRKTTREALTLSPE